MLGSEKNVCSRAETLICCGEMAQRAVFEALKKNEASTHFFKGASEPYDFQACGGGWWARKTPDGEVYFCHEDPDTIDSTYELASGVDVSSEDLGTVERRLDTYATLEAIAGVDGEAVLLMDSPRGTVVYFANTMGSSDVTELGEPLRKEIAAANREYSLEPGLFCVRAGGEGGGRLMDGLVEDASLGGGFDDWCDKVAEEVKVATN